MSNIIDQLLDGVNYPDNEDLLTGPKDGINYQYVSETYLNGFINYVNIICGYMIARYNSIDSDEWCDACKNIDMCKVEFHTNFANKEFDDILILAESENSYWIFWDDRDCSDCCIGKFKKSEVPKDVNIEEAFKVYCHDCLKESVITTMDNYYDGLKYIPKDHFTGWIKL